jgi:hypothetical protein
MTNMTVGKEVQKLINILTHRVSVTTNVWSDRARAAALAARRAHRSSGATPDFHSSFGTISPRMMHDQSKAAISATKKAERAKGRSTPSRFQKEIARSLGGRPPKMSEERLAHYEAASQHRAASEYAHRVSLAYKATGDKKTAMAYKKLRDVHDTAARHHSMTQKKLK